MRRSKHWTSEYNSGPIGGSFAFNRTISLVMAFLLVFCGFWSGWGVETARANGVDNILYVTMEGDDANGGTGWDDAFATLQKALDTADTRGGQTYQIWIAKGTYIPTHTLPASSVCVERIPDPPNPPEVWQCVRYEMQVDPQTAHFAMKNDVAIYGGFAGTEDPASFSLADRDFANNETILSGYLGVDPVTFSGLSAYHVFYHPNLALDATAVLDGVTISGGRGVEHQGYGGGMYNTGSSPALTNVTFSGNYAQYAGGAMANESSNPTLTHVTISGNEARSGGGVYNAGGSSPILTHVTISDNEAFIDEGGGMANRSGSSPVLTYVTISGNEANIGGGMYNSDSSPTLTNVTISGNKAKDISYGGKVGGGMYNRDSSLTLTHVTISGNWADDEAGGMYNNYSATTISNSIIWGNSTTDEYRPNIVSVPTFPVISHSLIEYSNGSGDNWNTSVGSDDGNNIDADPKFIDYQLATNDPTSSGDYRLRKDSPAINAGNNIDIPNGIITDLDGKIRVTGASVDMGAYEYERVLPVPRNLIGTAGDRQVTLSWDVVNFADSYEVYKYEGATGPVTTDDWELVASDINVTTYEVTELTNGTGYAFAVKAASTLGDSDFTDAAAVATPSTVTDAPTDVSATAGNGQAVVSFTVPTNNGGSAITGYTVTALVNGSATGMTETGTASPITVSGLTNGTAYTFTARATNALGDSSESDASGEVTPRTVPDAPSDVSATVENGQVEVSFTVPTNNGGNAITGYTVTALVNGSATGITATGTASPITVSGLTNGTAYMFTVHATNAAGNSAESSPTEPATPLPPASVPGPAPVPVVSTESGNNSLVVLVISTDGSITIPVGGSGEVSLGEEIYIVIPEGASEREQHITIEKVLNTEGLIPEGDTLASDIYELLKNFSETFDKPVTLTFVFDPSVAQVNQTFAIFYYDETEKKWIKVGGEVSGNTIRAEVDHFTKFAVFAIDEEASVTDRNAIAFSDISKHWAEESIKQAVLDGIITGFPDGTFRPDKPVSRAEFTVMLACALELDGSGASLPFTDRAEIGAWAEEAIAHAVRVGIVNGYGDGRFRPNVPITRSEMATMIARALQLPTEAIAQTGFTDDDRIPGWAKSAVESLRKLDIVNGRGDGKYVPNDKVTRAESVVALFRMLGSKDQD